MDDRLGIALAEERLKRFGGRPTSKADRTCTSKSRSAVGIVTSTVSGSCWNTVPSVRTDQTITVRLRLNALQCRVSTPRARPAPTSGGRRRPNPQRVDVQAGLPAAHVDRPPLEAGRVERRRLRRRDGDEQLAGPAPAMRGGPSC